MAFNRGSGEVLDLAFENISPALVGMAVDYGFRVARGSSPRHAFAISLVGAEMIRKSDVAEDLLAKVSGLDDESIVSICRLAGFDVVRRAGASKYRPVHEIKPDEATTEQIRTMVNRTLAFFEVNGPVIRDGLFFHGGYTETVSSGDGDLLTSDAIWDVKVSNAKPTKNHALQLLIYYLLSQNTVYDDDYLSISRIGIYNPRLDASWSIRIEEIPKDVIATVSREVVGYE